MLGAAAMGVGISEAVLWFIRRWLVARATMGVEADIRKDLYARLQILPMSFHGRWKPSCGPRRVPRRPLR